MEKISEVTEVRLFPGSLPPQLQVNASGIVPTAGWSHPQLKPHAHIHPPSDGIYDFDFIAERPDGTVPQVISVIHASLEMPHFPEALKGVRVHTSQNSKTALIDIAKPDRQPNRYIFTEGEGIRHIVFFPQRFGSLGEGESQRGPQLEYQGPEGQLTFRGDEIRREQIVLGALISVILHPNADAGGLDFAFALPPVKLGGKAHEEFETVGFTIRSKGRVIKHSGPELTYEILSLKGIAEDIPVL